MATDSDNPDQSLMIGAFTRSKYCDSICRRTPDLYENFSLFKVFNGKLLKVKENLPTFTKSAYFKFDKDLLNFTNGRIIWKMQNGREKIETKFVQICGVHEKLNLNGTCSRCKPDSSTLSLQ